MAEFIAEICSNHNNDLDRALKLIDTAAVIGCSGVKFQLFRIDELFAPEVLSHPDYQFVRDRRKWELPLHWLPIISERCHSRGIDFICTPFYLDAVKQLYPFVDRFKVASYELLWGDLLKEVARTGKPVILSTGMANIYEVMAAQTQLHCSGCQDLTILHCVSSYPARPFECGLNHFHDLKYKPIYAGKRPRFGWSDHSVSPGVIYEYAIGERADMVEFHLDLDGNGNEYGLGHCWLPSQIKPVIEACKVAEIVCDSVVESQAELKERLWRADPEDGLRPVKEMRKEL